MGTLRFLPLFLTLFLSCAVQAGGLLGGIVDQLVPGLGTSMDDVNRQLKDKIDPYKQLEEGGSKLVQESLVQAAAPLLQEAIARSKDDAISQGVQPMPDNIRANLEGYIPANILDMARFRVGGGGDLTLQVNAIRYGEAEAITLDFVIIFKDQQGALYNPSLWAHELTHVQQYQNWGIHDFSVRYVRDSTSVEQEAYGAQTRYAAWIVTRNVQQSSGVPSASPAIIDHPFASFVNTQPSSSCGTPLGTCQVNGSAPVGTSCWCGTNIGPAFGSLIPSAPMFANPQAALLPSGTLMQPCGCWGPNPNPQAPEVRCASGGVHVQVCSGYCAPNHPVYGYTCM